MANVSAKSHPYFAMTKKGQGTFIESEANIQKNLISYMKLQYPNVRVISTLNGIKLPIGLASQVAAIQSHRGIPDVLILEKKGCYCGLVIELKKEGERITKRNGDYVDEHVKEQAEYLDYLELQGFCAQFAIGFDQAKNMIDSYLSIEQVKRELQ